MSAKLILEIPITFHFLDQITSVNLRLPCCPLGITSYYLLQGKCMFPTLQRHSGYQGGLPRPAGWMRTFWCSQELQLSRTEVGGHTCCGAGLHQCQRGALSGEDRGGQAGMPEPDPVLPAQRLASVQGVPGTATSRPTQHHLTTAAPPRVGNWADTYMPPSTLASMTNTPETRQ